MNSAGRWRWVCCGWNLPELADGRLGFSESLRRMGRAIPAAEGGLSIAPPPPVTPPTALPTPPEMAPRMVADTSAASDGDIRWLPSTGCNPPEVMDLCGSGLSFNCGFSINCCCCWCWCCCCSCCCFSCCSCLARFKWSICKAEVAGGFDRISFAYWLDLVWVGFLPLIGDGRVLSAVGVPVERRLAFGRESAQSNGRPGCAPYSNDFRKSKRK